MRPNTLRALKYFFPSLQTVNVIVSYVFYKETFILLGYLSVLIILGEYLSIDFLRCLFAKILYIQTKGEVTQITDILGVKISVEFF